MKDDEAQLAALLHRGKKGEAIERLRQQTGLGLAEATAEIERIEMRATAVWAPSSRTGPAPAGSVDADIRLLAQQGRRIEAIKQLRERKRIGLKEAKDALDAAVPPPVRPNCASYVLVATRTSCTASGDGTNARLPLRAMSRLDAIVLECNHDPAMLEASEAFRRAGGAIEAISSAASASTSGKPSLVRRWAICWARWRRITCSRDGLHNSLRSVIARSRAVRCVAFLANSWAIGCTPRLAFHPEPWRASLRAMFR